MKYLTPVDFKAVVQMDRWTGQDTFFNDANIQKKSFSGLQNWKKTD